MSQRETELAKAQRRPPDGEGSREREEHVLRQGEQAFCEDLLELLKTHEGKWAAYRGPDRLGIADSDVILYRELSRQGYNPKELFIEMIHPEAARAEFSLGPTVS